MSSSRCGLASRKRGAHDLGAARWVSVHFMAGSRFLGWEMCSAVQPIVCGAGGSRGDIQHVPREWGWQWGRECQAEPVPGTPACSPLESLGTGLASLRNHSQTQSRGIPNGEVWRILSLLSLLTNPCAEQSILLIFPELDISPSMFPAWLLPVNSISMTHVPQPSQHHRCPSACKDPVAPWLLGEFLVAARAREPWEGLKSMAGSLMDGKGEGMD